MYSFLVIIGSWFVKLASNALVQSIVKNLIVLLISYGKDMIPVAIEEIKKASSDPAFTTSSQKFDAVFTALKVKFPNVESSTINVVIETCYSYFKSDTTES